jgi:hypothetical protein
MCDLCGYPSLDLLARADINTASLNMADDARRGTSIYGQDAQLYLSRMYTFRQITPPLQAGREGLSLVYSVGAWLPARHTNELDIREVLIIA